MKIALLQINPTVGDLHGNSRLIVDAVREAARLGADLAVTSELALMGYLPRDLLMSRGFVRRAGEELTRMAAELADVALYLLQLASISGIDLEQAILDKLSVNYGREWDDRRAKDS